MRHADRPSGPGKPIEERRDATTAQEESDEMAADRAVDGATADDLARQARGLARDDRSVAIVTIGGNDLLRGLAGDGGAGIARFEVALARFLRELPIERVVLGTVYDPTFGDDARNF